MSEIIRDQKTVQSANSAPERVRHLLELNTRFLISNANRLDIMGMDALDVLPNGTCPVVAPSHISDIDVQLAALALAGRYSPVLGSQSTNYTCPAQPFIQIAGKEHFFPMQWPSPGSHEGMNPVFMPEDYKQIASSIKDGGSTLTPFVAAHSPSYDGKLPKSPGIAAVYMAQMLDRVVVPVAVWLDDEPGRPQAIMGRWRDMLHYLGKRPQAHIEVCEPLELAQIDLSSIDEVLRLRKIDNSVLPELRVKYIEAKKMLQQQSVLVMQRIAEKLPEHKQGKWNKKQS